MNNKHIAVTVVSGTKTMTPANYDTALNQLVDIIKRRASLLLGADADPNNLLFSVRTVAVAQTRHVPSDHITLKELFNNPRDTKDLDAGLHVLVVHSPELNPRMNQPLRRMADQHYKDPTTEQISNKKNFDLVFALWGPKDKGVTKAQPVLRDLAGVRWTQANPAKLHAPANY